MQARMGENDYIDLLGDGNLHPAQLQYHVPRWLRGFPGQHKAIELVKLIHYRNLYKEKLTQHSPHRWHQLCKRIGYLLMYHNYNKQDEIRDERKLGLWEEVSKFNLSIKYLKQKVRSLKLLTFKNFKTPHQNRCDIFCFDSRNILIFLIY